MVKHLVLVADNIGAGKTSLAERLGERLGWHVAYESVTDFVRYPEHLEIITARVAARLSGREAVQFPNLEAPRGS